MGRLAIDSGRGHQASTRSKAMLRRAKGRSGTKTATLSRPLPQRPSVPAVYRPGPARRRSFSAVPVPVPGRRRWRRGARWWLGGSPGREILDELGIAQGGSHKIGQEAHLVAVVLTKGAGRLGIDGQDAHDPVVHAQRNRQTSCLLFAVNGALSTNRPTGAGHLGGRAVRGRLLDTPGPESPVHPHQKPAGTTGRRRPRSGRWPLRRQRA